jgi:hypothetical protein
MLVADEDDLIEANSGFGPGDLRRFGMPDYRLRLADMFGYVRAIFRPPGSSTVLPPSQRGYAQGNGPLQCHVLKIVPFSARMHRFHPRVTEDILRALIRSARRRNRMDADPLPAPILTRRIVRSFIALNRLRCHCSGSHCLRSNDCATPG